MLVSVLGAGSWGSALAIAFSHVAVVKLWSRDPLQVEQINACRTNGVSLPELIKFPANIFATTDFADASNADLVVIATPVSALRFIVTKLYLLKNKDMPDIIWVCKGFEVDSGLLPHQIIGQICPGVNNTGALLGPSFAEEVARALPTAITLASNNLPFVLKWTQSLKNIPNLRIYANIDLTGSEVGAGVKNIMAIAVGICDGLGLGFNARAALITRSLNELGQLVILLGGNSETIYGLTGIGDLILTCTGDLSRNRKVGLQLAKSQAIDTIIANLGHVAEGVLACREVYNLSRKLNIEMPIVEAVYKIIYEKADLGKVVFALLNREPKLEFSTK